MSNTFKNKLFIYKASSLAFFFLSIFFVSSSTFAQITTSGTNPCTNTNPASTTPLTAGFCPIFLNNKSTTINYNTSANIVWASINAESCTITKGDAAFTTGLSGTKSSGSLTSDTVFKLSCKDAGGNAVSSKLTIYVRPADYLPPSTFVYTIDGDPFSFILSTPKSSYNPGDTITLQGEVHYSTSYYTLYADQINIDIDYSHLVHAVAPGCNLQNPPLSSYCDGSRSITVPSTPGTHNIHVVYYISDVYKGVSQKFNSQIVKEYDIPYIVTSPSAPNPSSFGSGLQNFSDIPTSYIYSSPSVVTSGDSADISWGSTGSNSCSITKNGDVFSNDLSGNQSSGPLSAYTVFGISCQNSSGETTNDRVIVAVVPSFNIPTIQPFTPTEIVPDTSSAPTGNDGQVSAPPANNNVDIIIEPISYTPSFYKGSPLFPKEGTVKLIAIPDVTINGTKASSKNLTFTWKKDGIVLGEDSGIGKNSLIIDNGISRNRNIGITVSISDSSGEALAENSKTVAFNSPKIIFYENSPLYGILYNRAVNFGYNLGTKEELKIVAKPYFFNTNTDTSADLDYAWNVNGDSVTLPGRKNELLLRQTDTSSKGSASVSLDINNAAKIFQYTKDNFDVNFGQ